MQSGTVICPCPLAAVFRQSLEGSADRPHERERGGGRRSSSPRMRETLTRAAAHLLTRAPSSVRRTDRPPPRRRTGAPSPAPSPTASGARFEIPSRGHVLFMILFPLSFINGWHICIPELASAGAASRVSWCALARGVGVGALGGKGCHLR